MANQLFKGAEFHSYDDFKYALAQYCNATKVNGNPVEFIHSASKYIQNGTFDDNKHQRLVYKMKAERCKFSTKTKCKASFKLLLHPQSNGDHVLRLDQFDGNHNSHVEFVKLDATLAPTVNKQDEDELQTLLSKIYNSTKPMPRNQCDAITEILGNLFERIEKSMTFKVDFLDYPSENSESFLYFSLIFFNLIKYFNLDGKHRVEIVQVGSSDQKSKRQTTKDCKHNKS